MKSLDCLHRRGLMVSFGNASGPVDPFRRDHPRAEGLALPHPADALSITSSTREELEQAASELFDMVASGKVKIEVKQRFALQGRGRSAPRARSAQDDRSTILTI